MSLIDEYKLYKRPNKSNDLIVSKINNHNKIKRKNFLNFIQMKRFEKKYGDLLYKHFKVMNSLEDYQFLINIFGLKTIQKSLKDKEANTSQIAKILYEKIDEEDLYSKNKENNYVIKSIENCTDFYRATNIDLSEITLAIDPVSFSRTSLENKNMIQILKENNVNKSVLKEIYTIYKEEIIMQYNQDSYLRNKTILAEDEKRKNIFGNLQDHVTEYTEKDFENICNKYFNNENLTEIEKYIMLGLLLKETDLIGMYNVDNLFKYPQYIKSEVDIGIFNEMLVNDKKYTNDERKRIVKLQNVWNQNDFDRYNNLNLLKERISGLPQTQENLKMIEDIDKILSMKNNEIIEYGANIAESMDSIFMDYEVNNRNHIIESVYNPEEKEEIIISDLSQLDSAVMLHFFNPNRKFSTFEKYVEIREKEYSEYYGKEFHFSEEERLNLKQQYEAKENHFITDNSINVTGIGQVGTFDDRYLTNTSNQLSAMIMTPQDILNQRGVRGNIALGFSKKTLNPELIATISDKNIHSNKGIDYVESKNQFLDFSTNYKKLISDKNNGENNEIVMYRNSYESSLKPSYVMYIGKKSLKSNQEKKNIEELKSQMKDAGLKVPLIIFDRYSILEKNKEAEKEK